MKAIVNKADLGAYRTAIIALLLFIVWVLLVTGLHLLPAQAGQGTRGASPDRQLDHLKDRLALDESQVGQIRPILEDMSARREAIRERHRSQGPSGRTAAHQETQALRRETEARLAAILTEEQMESFRALQKEQRQRMGRRGQP